MTPPPRILPAAVLLAAASALAACSPREAPRGTRTESDAATGAGPSTVTQDAAQEAIAGRDSSRIVADQMLGSAKNAADQATNKVADAVITTSVNAELAKDPTLAAVHIDVDTDAGRVALKGTAPDQAARERAAQLAGNVKGVVSVENQLTVQGKS